MEYIFEWNLDKELKNLRKHGYSFKDGQEIFYDPEVIFLEDENHSNEEERYYAVGQNKKGNVLTVRYTWRKNIIRIFGVAHWRKWRKFYEENTQPK